MAALLTKKSFKVEFEVTLEMDEVEAQYGCSNKNDQHLLQLKRLQQALLEDENALLHQMMTTAPVYLTASSLTSNVSVALGGIVGWNPCVP